MGLVRQGTLEEEAVVAARAFVDGVDQETNRLFIIVKVAIVRVITALTRDTDDEIVTLSKKM